MLSNQGQDTRDDEKPAKQHSKITRRCDGVVTRSTLSLDLDGVLVLFSLDSALPTAGIFIVRTQTVGRCLLSIALFRSCDGCLWCSFYLAVRGLGPTLPASGTITFKPSATNKTFKHLDDDQGSTTEYFVNISDNMEYYLDCSRMVSGEHESRTRGMSASIVPSSAQIIRSYFIGPKYPSLKMQV